MLTIPDRHFEYITAIKIISQVDRDLIISSLSNFEMQDSIDDLINALSLSTKIEKSKIQAVLVIAGSIINTSISLGKNRKELLVDFQESLISKDDSYKLGEEDEAFLLKVAENKIVCTSFKSDALKADVQAEFEGIKIITDVRPIFSDDGREIYSTTFINTMIIEFLENGKFSSNYLSITEDDIDSMIRKLDRAKLKIAAVKNAYSKTEKA